MSRKKHAIRKAPYAHLDFTMRLALERAWNAYVRGNLRISVRFFARLHGLPESMWRRELRRGAVDAMLKTATTDNGREVSHQAVVPEGDGLLEGLDREDVLAVETFVNSIHRRSLKGETAHECHSRLAKTL